MGYFFAKSGPERQQALSELEKAVSRDVNVPEVIILLQREKKLEEFFRDVLTRYLVMVKDYIRSPEVPEQLRRQLKERLERFSRFKSLGEMDVTRSDDDSSPTLAGMDFRIQILNRRLDRIIKPRLESAAPELARQVNELMKGLDNSTKSLLKGAKTVEETEQKLLSKVGEFLFEEEESTHAEK